jgi:hypothetical protein
MRAVTITDLGQLESAHQRAEQFLQEATEAERAAFVRWQEAYGASDDAATSRARLGAGLRPVAVAPAGRAWKPIPARRPAPPIGSETRGAATSTLILTVSGPCPHSADRRQHTWQSGDSADLISLGPPDHGVWVYLGRATTASCHC